MTFTIVAVDPETRAIGAAVSTAAAACGKRVLHYRRGVGLVVTQGKTNVSYGIWGLGMLHDGLTPHQALSALQQLDSNRDYRQVLVSDLAGNCAVFTGSRTEPWHGHLSEPGFVVMGNTLASSRVLDVMASRFRDAMGSLGARLMLALLEGDAAGGDREGKRSAALLVTAADEFAPYGALLDLRIDYDDSPVAKLAQTLDRYLEWETAQLNRIDKSLYYFDEERAKQR